jgi:hypothetical protein
MNKHRVCRVRANRLPCDSPLEVKPHTRDQVSDNHRPLYVLLTIADIEHVKDISYDNIFTSNSNNHR